MHNVEQAQPTFCELGSIGRTFHVIELAGGLCVLASSGSRHDRTLLRQDSSGSFRAGFDRGRRGLRTNIVVVPSVVALACRMVPSKGAPHTQYLGTSFAHHLSPTILPLSPAYRMLAYGRCCSSDPAFLPAREVSIAPISPQCVNSHDSEAADDGYPCWLQECSRFT